MSAALKHEELSDNDEATNDWAAVLRTWQELDLPDGWKAEIADGGIRLAPPPSCPHNSIANRVHKALVRGLPDDWGIYQTLGLEVCGEERLYVPDLLVVPDEIVAESTKRVLSAHALLAVEITSKGNAAADRTAKRDAYARGGVDVYLLIDGWHEPWPRVTVYSEPVDGDYQYSVTKPFGETIHVPKPIDLSLDTSRFH
ncbi:Uma2 family endonuclease [Amycolatopsis taiwanensis]|uniref:Uma2 family endonuclease n=1 Tax=Amycolatopsis taiwanensis TaxID=342230 RepID=UPI000480AC85|nr:Uma2 family endonuclease [Amycolatopsis taiwanensis]